MTLPSVLKEVLESFNDEDKNGKQSHARGASGFLLLPPPSKPMAVARIFIDECQHDGILTLRYWRAGWWMWKTTHWVEVNDNAVRSVLYVSPNTQFISKAKTRNRGHQRDGKSAI
jgi:hypothetical protein